MSGWRLKVFAAVILGIGIIVTLPHYLEPPKYDQHDATMFGIAAAGYNPRAAKELIESEARDKWPKDPDNQRRYRSTSSGSRRP